nr:MAG: hypothetical protein [Helarchaeota virus Nidhogg Meg22_1214]
MDYVKAQLYSSIIAELSKLDINTLTQILAIIRRIPIQEFEAPEVTIEGVTAQDACNRSLDYADCMEEFHRRLRKQRKYLIEEYEKVYPEAKAKKKKKKVTRSKKKQAALTTLAMLASRAAAAFR